MGDIVKGVASLFGGRKRREEQKTANRGLDQARGRQDAFNLQNVYAGMDTPNISMSGYDPSQAQVGQLGPAQQAQLAQLAPSQGYTAQGYDSQGYDAQGTNVAGLARGANTGLTNTMANLQVSTAAADMQAREADQALAASQDLAAQAGTGAGGATALAAAAAKSKAGVSASIDQQVKRNEMLRAQGEGELQRAQLAQGNLASKFDLGQGQFNVGAQNKAAMFGAQAQNQAARFGAQAQNQAARFGAQSANQFSLAQFGAANQMNQFNAGQQNQFARTQFGAENQFALANQQAQNQAARFGANASNQGEMANAKYQFQTDVMERQGEAAVQQFDFDRLQDQTSRAMARSNAADEARAQAKANLIGGIAGIANAGVAALSAGVIGGETKIGKAMQKFNDN
tara:strand:+ start:42 stop:1238 length:1197 start_codon:yes stop_codon:yes gene_type:complete